MRLFVTTVKRQRPRVLPLISCSRGPTTRYLDIRLPRRAVTLGLTHGERDMELARLRQERSKALEQRDYWRQRATRLTAEIETEP